MTTCTSFTISSGETIEGNPFESIYREAPQGKTAPSVANRSVGNQHDNDVYDEVNTTCLDYLGDEFADLSTTAKVVIAIVQLGLAAPDPTVHVGSDPAEILAYIQGVLAPTISPLTEADILDTLLKGKTKGVFCRFTHSVSSPSPCAPPALVADVLESDNKFVVYSHMGTLPSNRLLAAELGGSNHQLCLKFFQ